MINKLLQKSVLFLNHSSSGNPEVQVSLRWFFLTPQRPTDLKTAHQTPFLKRRDLRPCPRTSVVHKTDESVWSQSHDVLVPYHPPLSQSRHYPSVLCWSLKWAPHHNHHHLSLSLSLSLACLLALCFLFILLPVHKHVCCLAAWQPIHLRHIFNHRKA